MSSTFASKTLPLSYTCCTLMPYSNGSMPIFVRSTACDAVTLVPSVTTFTSAINSTEPLTILVGILRVWKKFVDDGARLRRRLALVLGKDGADLVHVAVAEHETTVAVDGLNELVQAERVVDLHVLAQRRADHRVLAHQNGRLAAEGTADLLDLLGRNEIHRDHEDLRGLLDELDELLEVRGLLLLLHR